MRDDDLRQRLARAAEEFPVRGWPVELRRRVVHRRRAQAGVALAAGAVAAAGVAVAVPAVAGWIPGPDRAATPVVTASAADYVDSVWLLTDVEEGGRSFAIPAHSKARMALLPDGRILIDDSVNAVGGKFTKTADGFEVRDTYTTAVGILDVDPVRAATIRGMDALALGNLDGATPTRGPARNTVVSADGARLVIQTGTFRLTFVRTGPAGTAGLQAPPEPSATPS
jgi:hypothetical protein